MQLKKDLVILNDLWRGRYLLEKKKDLFMNYKKLHDSIINNAKLSKRSKEKGYFEAHHIVPRCFGGTDSEENIVLLTPKEHYLVHRLLIAIQKKGSKKYYQMLNAFSFMAGNGKLHGYNRVKVSSRFYEKIKTELAEKRKGKKRSDSTRRKISETKKRNPYRPTEAQRKKHSERMKGKGNPMYGRTHSDDVKKLLSELNKGKSAPYVSASNKRRIGQETAATKRVQQFTKAGELVNTFISIAEAKRQTGINSIIGVLRGRWKHAGGYGWKYVE